MEIPVALAPISDSPIMNPADVAQLLAPIRNLAQEVFAVVSLNAKHLPIAQRIVTVGVTNATVVHSREVFRGAISDGASSIIIAHNHPSGDPSPSSEDIRITRQMVDAGKILDISVLDHVILGKDKIFSMRESGLVNFDL